MMKIAALIVLVVIASGAIFLIAWIRKNAIDILFAWSPNNWEHHDVIDKKKEV